MYLEVHGAMQAKQGAMQVHRLMVSWRLKGETARLTFTNGLARSLGFATRRLSVEVLSASRPE